MAKEHFGVYLEPAAGNFWGLNVLVGIFENESSAQSFGESHRIYPLTPSDTESIVETPWYGLEPFRDKSKGKVWLTDFQRSAKYLHEEGYSMRKFSGEEVAEELGLVEMLTA